MFIQRKQKWKQEETLPVLTPGSLNFIELKNITIWSTNFYFIYILFYINFDVFIHSFYFITYFFHGKLNNMGNTAGWGYEEKVYEVCGILI